MFCLEFNPGPGKEGIGEVLAIELGQAIAEAQILETTDQKGRYSFKIVDPDQNQYEVRPTVSLYTQEGGRCRTVASGQRQVEALIDAIRKSLEVEGTLLAFLGKYEPPSIPKDDCSARIPKVAQVAAQA